MDSKNGEVTHDFPCFFKVYKDGSIHRYIITDYVPPGIDPATGVQTKDVLLSPETGVKARLFIPKLDGPAQKLPLVVHYHGGGFNVGSPFDTPANNVLKTLVSQANAIAISIDYRLAPEHPLPIAYDDSYAALQWVAKHSNGSGPEPWLNEHADLGRVFLGGESAGGTIAHNVAVQAGTYGLAGLKIIGVFIVHAYFGGKEPDEIYNAYKYMCPTSSGCDDDPKLNPGVDPNLKGMNCDRVLVCVAEKDRLRNRGVAYCETLASSGWPGQVELYETLDADHCFHVSNPNSEKAKPLMKKIVDFIKQA